NGREKCQISAGREQRQDRPSGPKVILEIYGDLVVALGRRISGTFRGHLLKNGSKQLSPSVRSYLCANLEEYSQIQTFFPSCHNSGYFKSIWLLYLTSTLRLQCPPGRDTSSAIT